MGVAIPYDIRRKIVERHESGESYGALSEAFGYSVSGVKKICRRWRLEGDSAFETKYSRRGRPKSFSEEFWKEVDQIRDNDQGASYVYSRLLMRYPAEACPSIRTIQRRWASQGSNRVQGRPSNSKKKMVRKAP